MPRGKRKGKAPLKEGVAGAKALGPRAHGRFTELKGRKQNRADGRAQHEARLCRKQIWGQDGSPGEQEEGHCTEPGERLGQGMCEE